MYIALLTMVPVNPFFFPADFWRLASHPPVQTATSLTGHQKVLIDAVRVYFHTESLQLLAPRDI